MNGFSLTYLGKSLVKILLATLALTGLLWSALPYFNSWLHGSIIHQGVSLGVLILSAALLYGSILHICKLDEMNILTEMIQSKILEK